MSVRGSNPGGVKRYSHPYPSILALGPTQPPVQWVLGASTWKESVEGMALTTHPHVLPPLRMSRGQLKCDGTCAETRFRLSAKWMGPFKSAGASVQSNTGG